ncbi:MAG: hypothetical protein DRP93_08310 [Candidatus Neomarinimicrobiota bacterium]|nr:MAG: hypothetical protein DRP93_08310 [Candidatus Neomarinimicrobiota bacterium]
MTERQNRNDEESAMARYLVVSQVCAEIAGGLSKTSAVETVANRLHVDQNGKVQRYGARSIWRWLGQWEKVGLEGLFSAPRARRDSCLPEDFLSFLKQSKEDDPKIAIPEIIRLAIVKGIIDEERQMNRTTVWRECRRIGLPTLRRDPSKRTRQRPWAFMHRMQCIMADGKFFRAGARRLKRVAIIFFDDATRFVLGAVVGTAESAELALRGLRKVLLRWGLMSCLYVDLGFDTKDLAAATAALRISLILGTRRYPEARGKIERFNRTFAEQLLCGWPGNPEIDPDLDALELRIEHWAFNQYNHTPHEGLGMDTPAERFHADSRQLRTVENRMVLDEAFVESFLRRVSNHNCIRFKGDLWEIPLGYRGQKIQVFRNMLSDEISVLHHSKRIPLKKADFEANAYENRRAPAQSGQQTKLRRTAADAAFKRDHPPLVDEDGNYSEDA